MSLRLQTRNWPHLQRFPSCEVLGDLFKVVSAAGSPSNRSASPTWAHRPKTAAPVAIRDVSLEAS